MTKNYGDPKSTRPYQCFMGRWEGLCKTFSPKGEFIESAAVHQDVYWIGDNSWHLYEDFEKFYDLGKNLLIEIDILVEGKFCSSKVDNLSLEGTEIIPNNYVFTIWSEFSNTIVYNNHYFLDPNNRRIITHKIRDTQTYIFQIQDFVRVVQP